MGVHEGVSWAVGRRLRRSVVMGTALSVSALVMVPVVHADTASTTAATTVERVIVRAAAGVDPAALVKGHGGTVVDTMSTLQSVSADVPADALEALRLDPGIIEVSADAGLQLVESSAESVPTADDIAQGRANAIHFVADDFANTDKGRSFDALTVDEVAKVIGADRANERGITGQGVDVAVIDTGIAPVAGVGTVINGPDLSFESQNPDLMHLDTNGHGTHLAGIISGIAPGSRLLNVKVGANNGAVDVSQVIAAIDWVVQHRNDNGLNVRVIHLAYGTQNTQGYEIDPLAHAAEVAWHHGIVVVAAAGNGGTEAGRLTNPAIDPYVLAVGASEAHGTYTTADDTVASFSSRGDGIRDVDVVAPGRSVVSLRTPGSFIDVNHPEGVFDDTRFRGSGTSQAAAVTSGSVALLLQERPDLGPDQVKAMLRSTAKKLPKGGSGQGSGIIDIDRALRVSTETVADADQTWTTSTGTGTLEGARGTSHVEMDGVVLEGEYDIFGNPWDGTSWSGTSWSGTSWSGGDWNGTSWSGTSWSGTSWSGTSWSGTSWSGTSWSGTSWSGTSWSGTSWSGTSWSGTSWSGTSWSGTSWS